MSPGEVKNTLRRLGVSPDRELGQNFLVNPFIAAKTASAVPRGESTLEIGPGLGSLTERLLERCGSLTAVEISRKMAGFLESKFGPAGLRIVREDFLRVDPSVLPGFPFRVVVGNLPYSISSPALFRLTEHGFRHVDVAVFMLQKEVAVRLSSLDGGREYGKLSLQIWPLFTVENLLDAEPGDFFPEPRVKSRVVVIRRRKEPLVDERSYPGFRKLVRDAFAMRRKTILNNLGASMGRERAASLLGRAAIDPGLRAERIPPRGFLKLLEAME